MKIYTKIVFDIETGKRLEEEFFEYDGPLALCDRAAQSQASQAEKTAGSTASQYGSAASGINSTLTPFLTRELTNPQGFTQGDLTQMLNYAEAGAGGANSGITGQANLEAARTRNASGFSSALDDAARQRSKALASTSEGIGAENAQLKQQQQQSAAKQLQGLYGTDTSAMLDSMGLQNQDINTEIKAGQSGWFQNLNQMLQTIEGGASAAGGLGWKPFGSGAGSGGGH